MEFDKSKVFTALNADELSAGDKVIVANDLKNLQRKVFEGFNYYIMSITSILGEEYLSRICIENDRFPLAYLVERVENCTNCAEGRWDAEHRKILCDPVNCGNGNVVFRNHEIEVCEYWKPKTEQKAEPHYRPFRDTLEMLKCWYEKRGEPPKTDADCLSMPHIWVRLKDENAVSDLITGFGEKEVKIDGEVYNFDELMSVYEFLDGSPCGVKE